jgi:hypothetical protein
MTRTHARITVTTIVLTALALTGCSHSAPTPSPTPTKSAAAAPDGQETPAYENACDGDQAVLSGDGVDHRLPKGCSAVSVVSSGSAITLGPTKSLVVEGDNNDITVESLDAVMLLGTNNDVHVKGDDPEVDDQGTGNTID